MATYNPSNLFSRESYEQYGKSRGVTNKQEDKKANTSFASGSTYDEVPQVITSLSLIHI